MTIHSHNQELKLMSFIQHDSIAVCTQTRAAFPRTLAGLVQQKMGLQEEEMLIFDFSPVAVSKIFADAEADYACNDITN